MHTEHKPAFFTLLLLFSFAAVNAVLYTPALPEISKYFNISSNLAEQSITLFLLGYAIGQLLYGPIANRYGRLPAIYVGVGIQILSNLACVAAVYGHSFELFSVARFMVAIGSGVGLKITFTLVNEYYPAKVANQKVAYLVLIFAIAPGLSVTIGGMLTHYFHWVSCFYFLAAYGLLVFFLSSKLPETKNELDLQAFEPKHLIEGYTSQFKIPKLIVAGLLMGSCSALVYMFATLAPFIAIEHFGMTSAEYGFANLLPSVGMFLGGFLSLRLVHKFPMISVISIGTPIICLGVSLLILGMYFEWPPLWGLFVPAMITFAGNSLLYGNSSTLGLQATRDKAHGSSVMNFINMGLGTLAVLSLCIPLDTLIILPVMSGVTCFIIVLNVLWLRKSDNGIN